MIFDNRNYRDLVKTFDSFGGFEKVRIFESLLDYIIYGFCLNGGFLQWDYTKEQTDRFREMFRLWVLAVRRRAGVVLKMPGSTANAKPSRRSGTSSMNRPSRMRIFNFDGLLAIIITS